MVTIIVHANLNMIALNCFIKGFYSRVVFNNGKLKLLKYQHAWNISTEILNMYFLLETKCFSSVDWLLSYYQMWL